MTYLFYCIDCHVDVDVDCLMKDRDKKHKCPHCDTVLVRAYAPTPHTWNNCEWPGGYKGGGSGH